MQYKDIFTLQQRLESSKNFFKKYPGWYPVCLELGSEQNELPSMEHRRFGFRGDLTLRGVLLHICKNTQGLERCEPLYFIVGGEKFNWTNQTSLESLYSDFGDDDGYLYITYYFVSDMGKTFCRCS